jgi:phage gp29-like protein
VEAHLADKPTMRQLLDQFGQPVSPAVIAQMREEISPPSAIASRPPFAGHMAFGMDPGRLGSIVRAADDGSSQEWFILAEEIEELFSHYGSVLSKRKRQVSQLPLTIEAARGGGEYDTHADFVRDWIDSDVLAGAMFDIMDAVGKGFSALEILWEQRPGYCAPSHIEYRPQRFFEISWKDGRTIWLRTGAGFVDLAPLKFLVHAHRSKSGNIVRGGLTRQVAFLWMYSAFNIKDWAVFCQAYGFPIRVGRYGPEASDTDRNVLWRAVSTIAGDVGAIIPKSMEIEFVKDSERNAGSELYLKRADWLNREVSKLVLGSTAGTEAIAGGHAVGREHRQIEDDVEKFDAGLLATSITRQIVQPMIALTFGPQERYPVLRIGRQDQVPLNDVIAGVVNMVPLGLRPRVDEIMSRLQLTPADAGEETLMPPPAPPVAPPKVIEAPVPEQNSRKLLTRLLTRQTGEIPPEVVERLTDNLAADAQSALAGMTEQVRAVFDQADSLHDLAHRLSELQLDPSAFAKAMQQGMAMAELVGQAALLDELRPH